MTYTSIKIKQRKSVASDSQIPLFIQLIRHRKMKRISLKLRIYPEEWAPEKQIAVIPPGTERIRCEYLLHINDCIGQARQVIGKIVRNLECKGDFTVDDIIAAYNEQVSSANFSAYIKKQEQELTDRNQHATAHHYRSLQNSFIGFLTLLDKDDIPLSSISETTVIKYESHLNARKLAPNTVSFYMRTLRAVWNKAVFTGLVEDKPGLFKRVNTRIEKTQKRSIKEKDIKKLEHLTEKQLASPALIMARDLFLFSFYTRGMAFVDIAHLTKDNIQGNTLVYIRKKTGQELHIKLLPEIKKLIARYHSENSPYLFPILNQAGAEYRKYESALRLQNMRLKKVGKLAGCYLTTYIARHTWASVAKNKGISEELISEGMGHNSVKTTRIYIATLDYTRVDRMNEFVISGNDLKKCPVRNSVSW